MVQEQRVETGGKLSLEERDHESKRLFHRIIGILSESQSFKDALLTNFMLGRVEKDIQIDASNSVSYKINYQGSSEHGYHRDSQETLCETLLTLGECGVQITKHFPGGNDTIAVSRYRHPPTKEYIGSIQEAGQVYGALRPNTSAEKDTRAAIIKTEEFVDAFEEDLHEKDGIGSPETEGQTSNR